MAGQDRFLSAARLILRGFLLINVGAGAVFAIAILASFPMGDTLLARLTYKYGPTMDVVAILWGIRLLMLASIGAAVVLRRIFRALLAVVDTVRAEDPFTEANATRLRTIAWGMLILQLLDLGLGAFTGWARLMRFDFVDWSPSFSGWIVVLMLFVLARVFRRGAEMRDDLAMTV